MKKLVFKSSDKDADKFAQSTEEKKANPGSKLKLIAIVAAYLVILLSAIFIIPMLISDTTGTESVDDPDSFIPDFGDMTIKNINCKSESEEKLKINALQLVYISDPTKKIENIANDSSDYCLAATVQNKSDTSYEIKTQQLFGGTVNDDTAGSGSIISRSTDDVYPVLEPGDFGTYIIPLGPCSATGEDFSYEVKSAENTQEISLVSKISGTFTLCLKFAAPGSKDQTYSGFYTIALDTEVSLASKLATDEWYSYNTYFKDNTGERVRRLASLKLNEDGKCEYREGDIFGNNDISYSGTYSIYKDRTAIALNFTCSEGEAVPSYSLNFENYNNEKILRMNTGRFPAVFRFIYSGEQIPEYLSSKLISAGDQFESADKALGKPFYSYVGILGYNLKNKNNYTKNYYFVDGNIICVSGYDKIEESLLLAGNILSGIEYETCEVVDGNESMVEFKITNKGNVSYYVTTWVNEYKNLSFIGMFDYFIKLEKGFVQYTKGDSPEATIFYGIDEKVYETEPYFGVISRDSYGTRVFRLAARLVSDGTQNYIEVFDIFQPFKYCRRISLPKDIPTITSIEFKHETEYEDGTEYIVLNPSEIVVLAVDNTQTFKLEYESEQIYISSTNIVKKNDESNFEFTVVNKSGDDYYTSLYYICQSGISYGPYESRSFTMSAKYYDYESEYLKGSDTVNGIIANRNMDIKIGAGQTVKVYLPISYLPYMHEDEVNKYIFYSFYMPLINSDRTQAFSDYIIYDKFE